MRKKFLHLTISLLALSLTGIASESLSIHSSPVGVMEVSAAAGTGTGKVVTLLSAPLLRAAGKTGAMSGTISGVEITRLLSANAGWHPSEITNPAQPHGLMITSGTAAGRMFLIVNHSDNSSSAIQVADPHNRSLNLTTLGIQPGTDTYQIFELDTIKTLFGEPDLENSFSVQSGPAAQQADVVTLTQNGSVSSYFFSTIHKRWTAIRLGSPDGSNTPIMPYYGIQYNRLAPHPLKIILSGEVPRLERQMTIPAQGATLISSYWPVTQRLAQTGLADRPEWRRGVPANSDRVVLTSGAASSTYYHDGQNWRRIGLGSPLSNDTVIGTGSALLIIRPSAGSALPVTQGMPYNL